MPSCWIRPPRPRRSPSVQALHGLGSAWLELIVPSVCPGCDASRRPGEDVLCSACTAGLLDPPARADVDAAVAYAGSARELVQRFKFEARADAGPVLVALAEARVRASGASVLVPVPRHRARIRETGCDPVHVLTRALARAAGLGFRPRALRRAQRTPPQTQLSGAARRRSLTGSFAARPGALRGERALVVDAVVTTGRTLALACATLRTASGARQVRGFAIAALAE